MTVYMIQSGGPAGPVKIGKAISVEARLATLRGLTVEELTVIRTVDGYTAVEIHLHRYFDHVRIRGEWFAYHPDMLTVSVPIADSHTVRCKHVKTDTALSRYLAAPGAPSLTEFARLAEIGVSYMHEIREGKKQPSLAVACCIRDASGGAVTLDDLAGVQTEAA